MKKFLFLFILLGVNLFAQTAGSSGLSFLKLGFGARNIAMSDFGAAGVNDLTALHYNPAMLDTARGPQLAISHNQLIQDVFSEMIAGSFSIFGLPFAVGVNTTSVPGIEIRTQPGDPQATFNAHFFSASISTAHPITEDITAGATVKYVYESMLSDNATGLAFDLGVKYTGLMENLTFGASMRNLGSMNELRTTATKLPADLRIGFSYLYPLESIKSVLNAVAGYQKYTSTSDNHIHVGAELLYDGFLALRAGYMSGYDSKSISAGLGVVWGKLNFDYAYVPYKYSLGDSHIISVAYNF